MMDALALKQRLCEALVAQSGLERHRSYLGMSGIGRCARELYWRYVDGLVDMDEQHHWQSWLGYLFEGGVVKLLDNGLVVRQPVEVVADFDHRFRGHVDFVTGDGDLVEIKSVDWAGFEGVRKYGPKRAHRAQMQMYLRHGLWSWGFLVYVARDVPWRVWTGIPFWVFEVVPEPEWGKELDDKARMILGCVDDLAGPPTCECGRCRR
jgi:hypothetical protein